MISLKPFTQLAVKSVVMVETEVEYSEMMAIWLIMTGETQTVILKPGLLVQGGLPLIEIFVLKFVEIPKTSKNIIVKMEIQLMEMAVAVLVNSNIDINAPVEHRLLLMLAVYYILTQVTILQVMMDQ